MNSEEVLYPGQYNNDIASIQQALHGNDVLRNIVLRISTVQSIARAMLMALVSLRNCRSTGNYGSMLR
jgi:hypothetical protein